MIYYIQVTPISSKAIQLMLFDLGWSWTTIEKKVRFTDQKWLFIYEDGKNLGHDSCKNDDYFIDKSEYKRVTFEELVQIVSKPKKPEIKIGGETVQFIEEDGEVTRIQVGCTSVSIDIVRGIYQECWEKGN